jgi:hypothetical protein
MVQLAEIRRGTGEPAFHELEQNYRLWLVHREENGRVHVIPMSTIRGSSLVP